MKTTPSISGSACDSRSDGRAGTPFPAAENGNLAARCELCGTWVPVSELRTFSPAIKPALMICAECARDRADYTHRDPAGLSER